MWASFSEHGRDLSQAIKIADRGQQARHSIASVRRELRLPELLVLELQANE